LIQAKFEIKNLKSEIPMPYLVVDLEMSGPEPGYHEIIQIGAVLLNDNWVELGTFLTNVYPPKKCMGFRGTNFRRHL
jgi:DNA polymerase III epsilon subunit-like protein